MRSPKFLVFAIWIHYFLNLKICVSVVFLDIIHPVSIYSNIFEMGFCLHIQVEPTQLGPVIRASP
jgi:hypothetical protein